MNLFFEGLALHDVGEVSINSESTQYFPEELGHRRQVTLEVQVQCFEQSYDENYSKILAIVDKLSTQHGRLKWVNNEDDIDPTLLECDATVASYTKPASPNASGTYHQSITIVFRYDKTGANDDRKLNATFKKTGSVGDATTLGNVSEWNDGFTSKRFSMLRNMRQETAARVTMSGEFNVSPTISIADRRITLAAQKAVMDTACDGADGTLTYGPAGLFFDKLVKVESWECRVNQAVTSISWNLTASYTRFPDETGYAVCDFKVSTNVNKESGEQTLQLTGRISSENSTHAIAKLDAIRNSVLVAEGFIGSQNTDSQIDKANIDSADGADFTELTFSESYRKRAAGITSYTLTIVDDENTSTSLITRTYSGSVVAYGDTADSAYAAAALVCRQLGDNKHEFRMTGRLTRQERKVATGAVENVRLDFSYEYKLKGKRIYLEVQSETSNPTFAASSERVSGFVVAESHAKAQEAYEALVLANYAGLIIESQSTSTSTHRIQRGDYDEATGVFAASNGFVGLESRFDFQLSVFRGKADNTYALKYSIRISEDLSQLAMERTVSGKFIASKALLVAAMAKVDGNKLTAFLNSLGFGTAIRLDRAADYEQVGDSLNEILEMDFSAVYRSVISGSAQILQVELSEKIQFSGPRWVVQDVADGPSIAQLCGESPGSRTVSGTVLAATESAAMAYVKRAHAMHFTEIGVGGNPTPGVRYESAPEISKQFEFLELIEGEPKGDGANFKAVRVSFSFQEILLQFPWQE